LYILISDSNLFFSFDLILKYNIKLNVKDELIDGLCKGLTEKLHLTADQLQFLYNNYDIHSLIPNLQEKINL